MPRNTAFIIEHSPGEHYILNGDNLEAIIQDLPQLPHKIVSNIPHPYVEICGTHTTSYFELERYIKSSLAKDNSSKIASHLGPIENVDLVFQTDNNVVSNLNTGINNHDYYKDIPNFQNEWGGFYSSHGNPIDLSDYESTRIKEKLSLTEPLPSFYDRIITKIKEFYQKFTNIVI